MVRIRLRRMGSKKQPIYRIVVTDKESPRDGRFIEIVGTYNPRTEPETVTINEEPTLYYLKHGAQPSDPVARLLKKTGTMDRFERLKKGEAPATLLAEAQTQFSAEAPINPKTRIGRKAAPKLKKEE